MTRASCSPRTQTPRAVLRGPPRCTRSASTRTSNFLLWSLGHCPEMSVPCCTLTNTKSLCVCFSVLFCVVGSLWIERPPDSAQGCRASPHTHSSRPTPPLRQLSLTKGLGVPPTHFSRSTSLVRNSESISPSRPAKAKGRRVEMPFEVYCFLILM